MTVFYSRTDDVLNWVDQVGSETKKWVERTADRVLMVRERRHEWFLVWWPREWWSMDRIRESEISSCTGGKWWVSWLIFDYLQGVSHLPLTSGLIPWTVPQGAAYSLPFQTGFSWSYPGWLQTFQRSWNQPKFFPDLPKMEKALYYPEPVPRWPGLPSE